MSRGTSFMFGSTTRTCTPGTVHPAIARRRCRSASEVYSKPGLVRPEVSIGEVSVRP